jgi:NhaA family Na+:H+ antiporter
MDEARPVHSNGQLDAGFRNASNIMNHSLDQLPKEPVDYFTKPFARFLRIEAASGAVLVLVIICALLLSNSRWSTQFLSLWELPLGIRVGAFELSHSLRHWINGGLMTLFFFIVALELKREVVLGELRNPRIAALSIAGALGGMVVPPILYRSLVEGDASLRGWGVVMATDTAFMIGCLAILGARVPLGLRLFLLSLVIFDDIGAILVVAVGYGGPLNAWALALSGAALGIAAVVARLGVRSLPIYFAIGVVVWLALDSSGIHPTLAGVALGLMTPARGWVSDDRLRAILNRVIARPPGGRSMGDSSDRRDLQRAGIAAREALSPVERLEILLHPWVAFAILPLFAFANAGIHIAEARFDTSVAGGVFVGLFIGKPLGVVLCSWLAVSLRIARLPPQLDWKLIAAGSLLTGIGFTMATFIAELALGPALLNSAKIGIFATSAASGLSGLVALGWLTSSRRRARAAVRQ